MEIIIIASAGENNELGREGDLCWHIREDLRHFKELTMGGAVVMGRKTWESLPRRPLPGRLNIVVSRSPEFQPEGALKAASIEDAVRAAGELNVYIIGGESVYRQALPAATAIELTRILASDPHADKYFPEIPAGEWHLAGVPEEHISEDGIRFRFERYER